MSHFGEKGHRRGTLSSRLGCKQICHGASACGVIPLRVRLHLSRESKVICCKFGKQYSHNAQRLIETMISLCKTLCYQFVAWS